MINIAEINRLTKELSSCRNELHEAKSVLQGLRCLGNHQSGVHIKVGGHGFNITEICSRSYMSKLKKGHEMVLLGLIKIADSEVDRLEAVCRGLEAQILKFAQGGE